MSSSDMSPGPSPSDENIDFKVKVRRDESRPKRPNPILAALVVLTLALLFIILFIQQRKIEDLTNQVNDLARQIETARADIDKLVHSNAH